MATHGVPSRLAATLPYAALRHHEPDLNHSSIGSLSFASLALPPLVDRADAGGASGGAPERDPMMAVSPQQPAPPPNLLPRNVAPPNVTTSPSHTRLPMRQQWDASQRGDPGLSASLRSESSAGLPTISSPQELPPLRDTHSMCADPLRAELKTPGGRLTLQTPLPPQRAPAQRLSSQVEASEEDRVSLHEIEHLKRQVARLTQLRRDRDNYIQDLLGDAEMAQRRHEGEMQRRVLRTQREATERLTTQQKEHDIHLEERSRAHASTMSQQALQHEAQLEELRKALRTDGERRLAEHVTELSKQHWDTILHLQGGVEVLRQRLTGHAVALEEAVLEEQTGMETVLTKSEVRAAAQHTESAAAASCATWCRSSLAQAIEPEPEHGDAPEEGTTVSDQVALAERAAVQAMEGAEWAIACARKELDRALVAGQHLSVQVTVAHDARMSDATSYKRKLSDANELHERVRGRLRCQTRDWVAIAAAAGSHALLLKVYVGWLGEVQRLRALAAERKRVLEKRKLRQPQILARISADVEHQLYTTLRMWVVAATDVKRQATQERLLKECSDRLAEVRKQAAARQAERLRKRDCLRIVLFGWIVATREAKREAAHRHALITAAADASAEVYRLRSDAKKVTMELRRQRRAHGVAAVHANLDRRLQSVVHAWGNTVREAQREVNFQRQLDIAAAEAAAGCAVLRMEGRRVALELREKRQEEALKAIEAGLRHWRHAVLLSWAFAAAEGRREVDQWRGAHGRAVSHARSTCLVLSALFAWRSSAERQRQRTQGLRRAQQAWVLDAQLQTLRAWGAVAAAAFAARRGEARLAELAAETRREAADKEAWVQQQLHTLRLRAEAAEQQLAALREQA